MVNRRGFTLVELIVIIVVIAILATIASLGLNKYLEDGRDTRRASNITTIAEALEKYYDEHGEYPGCDAMTASAESVSGTLLNGIDQSALRVPNADESVTNSIRCGETLTANTSSEFIEYVGDGSADCNGAGSCLSYKLRYVIEAENTVAELNSRRAVAVATSGTATLTAGTVTYTSGNLSWTKVPNTLNYVIQRSSSNSFSSVSNYSIAANTLSRQFTDMAPNTTEYFRVKSVTSQGDTAWSNVVSLKPNALTSPTLSSTQDNPQQLTQDWTSIGGATSYTIQRSSSSGFTTGVENSTTSDTTKVYSDTPIGVARYYRVRGTVTNSAGTVHPGPWSNVITYTSTVPQPTSAPTISVVLSGSNAVGTSSTVACTQGAVPYYQLRESAKSNSGSADSWSSWSSWSSSVRTRTEPALQGHEHKMQANAACVYAGSYSTTRASGTDTVVRGISQPAAPTWPAGLPTSWKNGQSGYYMNYGTSCPAGTWVSDSWYRSYAWNGASPRDYYHTFGYNDYWYLGPSGGATVEYWARYVCGTSYTNSAWSPERYSTIWIYP